MSALPVLPPVADCQSEFVKLVFGERYWNGKKKGYEEQRSLARKGRDMGMLSGGETDPVVLQSLFLEKTVCEKSRYVNQVCVLGVRPQ